MKRARVAYSGAIHEAVEYNGQLQLCDGRIVNEEEVIWLPPVESGTVFALGLNYADHAKELAFNAPDEPLVFLKGPNTFIGHRGQTRRPADATYMHYECELAVVIGRKARNVKKEDAYQFVAGYTIANDYAIRDYLENYYRPNLRVKNRDTCTPIGPWLVDSEDIPDPMNLTLRTFINGKLTQEGSTKDMIFSITDLIEYFSSFMTLNPGDIILTGTPEGLADTAVGDEVITEIEGIGRLINTIIGDDLFLNKKEVTPSSQNKYERK
ncbi:fumarylacetoacetate hydrolase family protein [Bacillus sp. JJ722]|uniref:fumarylacetoacetate hydrolase family protein n=1 Tax=Bacillus sp. JJ722 TaxID=3122973 RepID=UPI002FFE513D